MKQFIFIILLLIISLVTSAQGIHGYFESGYNLIGHHTFEYEQKFDFKNSFYIDIQLYLQLFDCIKVGGTVKTNFAFQKIDEYDPFLSAYTVFTSWTIKNIELGFSHTCTHSKHEKDILKYDGADRRLYMKIIF